MTFTPIQERAIRTLDKNILLNAGAGSGKTRVLVERYLHLLDMNLDWSLNSLVAVTFTQKAAAEMRERVRRALSERYEKSRHDEALSRRWANILTAMDSARIDTIHGLCASILRANAAEAGIDPEFVVLDEIEAAILLDNVIDDLLRTLARGDDDPSTSGILALFEAYDMRDVREILKAFAATSVILPALSDDVMDSWRAMWRREGMALIDGLREDTGFWKLAAWQDGIFPEGDKITDAWLDCHGLQKRLRECQDLEAAVECLMPISKINLQGGSPNAWGGRDALREAKAGLEIIRDHVKSLLEQIGEAPNETDEAAAQLIPVWHSLIMRMKAAYVAAKRARAALDFDDLEVYTRDLLVKYPHVRARYRNAEFQHVLVDEFQDTNAVQWEIVRALADIDAPGRVFVVGDPKQSIYAFRGADVSVFERVREQFKRLKHGEELNMPLSFRTHHPLVGGFNHFFHQLLVRDQSSVVKLWQVEFGEGMEAFRRDAPASYPPIEFLMLHRDQLPEGQRSVDDARLWEAQAIAERLREIVEIEHRPVYDREMEIVRPIRYGDIALLFQAMGNAPLYERALKAAGLPYVTIAGQGYYDRQEVWDVLNLLRALYHPGDNLSLAAALRSPMFGLSDEMLLDLRSLQDEVGNIATLWNALESAASEWADESVFTNAHERPLVQWAWATLHELRVLAGRVSIHELLRVAYERTGILAVLTGLPDGDRRRGNLEKLLTTAELSGKTTLSAFTHYLSDLTQGEVREGEAMLDAENAVTLMTVHKSKGLEFPLVVLVDASRTLSHNMDNSKVLFDPVVGLSCKVYSAGEKKYVDSYATRRTMNLRKERDEAERKRLLYVAATRAQDYLIISGQVRADRNSGVLTSDGWMKWLIDGYRLHDADHDGEEREYDWGKVLIKLPEAPADLDGREASIALDSWMIGGEVEPKAPPLMRRVMVERDAPARAMSVTQIADLGGALYGMPMNHRELFRQRWRRSILYATPGRIEFISDRAARAMGRKVGEIVHRVLQLRDPEADSTELKSLIDSFAWEEGFIDPAEREKLVNLVLLQLGNVAKSHVQNWIRSARRVYRELPFVFKTEKRMIHGVMDVLIERDNGEWAVIDYKTNQVRHYKPARSELEVHAKRYVLQVGVYAAAVDQLVGSEPRAYIHYIQHGETVEIAREVWKNALAGLESHIGDLMGGDEP